MSPDYCLQCAQKHLSTDTTWYKGLSTKEQTQQDMFVRVECLGCGDEALVDYTGKCVSRTCTESHGTED